MFNAFLKIEGVNSVATQKGFEGQIALDSFNLGASNPITNEVGEGMGAGKVNVSNFNVSKATDAASPVLFQACCQGKHFPNAVISICKAGGEQAVYLEYKFDKVFIASIDWSGGGGDERPMETLSLAFHKVQMTYKKQKADGTLGDPVVAGWDLVKAVPV